MNDVRQFGAVGDGVADDTRAVQAAIDAGGVAYFPPGTYLCASLLLRSNGGLELAAGARILAHPDLDRWRDPETYGPEHRKLFNLLSFERVEGRHLIAGCSVENVVIRGEGTIDGNIEAFFPIPPKPIPGYRFDIKRRPAQLLYFAGSSDITLSGVTLTGVTYWTTLFFGCERVRVTGVRFLNHRHTPNGDGLDLNACRDVTVSDCVMRTGDDCIAIQCMSEFLDQPSSRCCENITITNCVLSTICNAIRFGVGSGTIRRVTMSNIVVTESRTAINMAIRLLAGQNTNIEEISFSDFNADCVRPFSLHSNGGLDSILGRVDGKIRDISFRNFFCRCSNPSLIDAMTPGDIEDIDFDNIRLTLSKPFIPEGCDISVLCDDKILPIRLRYDDGNGDYTEAVYELPPAAFYLRRTRNVSLHRVKIRREEEIPELKHDLLAVACEGTELDGCRLPGGISERP